MKYLIVGLGNPGKEYEKTRHNIGFEIVKKMAEDRKLNWKKSEKFLAEIAEEEEIGFLRPMTYMNESGLSVKRVVDYFKVELKNLLLIVDDADIPFGELRLKANSGHGGHNGLKSVEENLSSKEYVRLRIGIGGVEKRDLAPYVLSKFNKEERSKLAEIINEAVEVVALWLNEGIEKAMNRANVRKVKEIKDEREKISL